MSIRCLSRKTVVARKDHVCNLCELAIPTGAEYVREHCVEDGYPPHVFKMHAVCERAAVADGWRADEWETPLTGGEFVSEVLDPYLREEHTDD